MKHDFDLMMATFERMLRICHEALSPTATPRQKSEARQMLTDWLKSRPSSNP